MSSLNPKLAIALVFVVSCWPWLACSNGTTAADAADAEEPRDDGGQDAADDDAGYDAADDGEGGDAPDFDAADDAGDEANGDGADGEGDTAGDESSPERLTLISLGPSRGGCSVATTVSLVGTGFGDGLLVFVGESIAGDVEVVSSTLARAVFAPVPLTERGPKDVRVELGQEQAVLPAGFEYFFDEDPIVFVHGYMLGSSEWAVMMDRFRQLGYPDDALFAIDYLDSTGSNLPQAQDELPAFLDTVLLQTGAERIDLVAHSNGGMSTRLWIKFWGGDARVRDYVTLSGTHHGTWSACGAGWTGEAALEQCPPFATETESHNLVQWMLNGDPDSADIDETPFGVEDGGAIAYHALWTEDDLIDLPPETCCLNQSSRADCSDPVNLRFSGVGHIEMATDQAVFEATAGFLRERNPSKP